MKFLKRGTNSIFVLFTLLLVVFILVMISSKSFLPDDRPIRSTTSFTIKGHSATKQVKFWEGTYELIITHPLRPAQDEIDLFENFEPTIMIQGLGEVEYEYLTVATEDEQIHVFYFDFDYPVEDAYFSVLTLSDNVPKIFFDYREIETVSFERKGNEWIRSEQIAMEKRMLSNTIESIQEEINNLDADAFDEKEMLSETLYSLREQLKTVGADGV